MGKVSKMDAVLDEASTMSKTELYRRHPGLLLHHECHINSDDFIHSIEEHFVWIQEALVEMKKSMNLPEIQLIPKTPSAKRTRQILREKHQSQESEEEEVAPKKARGKKAAKSLRAAKTSSSTRAASNRSTRSTRSRRGSPDEEEDETNDLDTIQESAAKIKAPKIVLIQSTTDEDEVFDEPVPKKQNITDKSAVHIQSAVMSSPSLRSTAKSPRTPSNTGSPMPIPGFSDLSHVKEKVDAFEKFGRHSHSIVVHDSSSSEESNATPRKKQKMTAAKIPQTETIEEIPDTPEKQPKRSQSKDTLLTPTLSLSKQLTVSLKDCVNDLEDSNVQNVGSSQLKKAPPAIELAEEIPKVSQTPAEKSSRRSSNVKRLPSAMRLSGVHKTKAQKRSSLYRKNLRNSLQMEAAAIAAAAEEQQDKQEEEPEQSSRSARSKMRVKKDVLSSISSVDECTSSAESGAEPPRRTRSKMRINKPAPPKLSLPDSDDEPDAEQNEVVNTPEQPKRSTRSKMRHPPKHLGVTSSSDDGTPSSQKGASADDEDDTPMACTPVQPQRTTRSKMRHKAPVQKLPAPSTSEDEEESTPVVKALTAAAPFRSTRSKMRKPKQDMNESEVAPPERSILQGSGEKMWHNDSQYHQPLHAKSFLNQVKKHPVAASNLSTVVHSFIHRNTPKKQTTKEVQELRRKELEAKKREAENRIKRQKEQMQKKAEEVRKKREERQKMVAQRREELEKQDTVTKKVAEKKQEDKKNLTAKLFEEKLREEREKQKQREKKIAEAEQRRKQEEEQKVIKQKEQEEEQRRQEETIRRRREFEEAERQRKIAEQKRQEDERKAEAERQRQAEAERIRQLEEQRRKVEEEKRKQKEEKERKEREERERQELEKQREKEKIRQAELEKEREKQRKLQQEQAVKEAARKEEERRAREEEKRTREAIQKHNTVLQTNTSLNKSQVSSGQSNLNSTFNKDQSTSKAANLNSTFEGKPKEDNPDSYDMTPTRKPVKKQKKEDDNDYNINDLHSDDSTDDEDAPRKRIPTWAQGSNLKMALINQHYNPPNLDEIFSHAFPVLDLNTLFKKRKPRFNKRTSSACWDSPMLKPSGAPLI